MLAASAAIPPVVTDLLLIITSVGVVAAGAFVTWRIRRRDTSGRIATSEAATLWAEAQSMRTLLLEEKKRAEDQRDRLMESQATQMLPTLAALGDTVREMGAALGGQAERLDGVADTLDRVIGRLDEMIGLLDEPPPGWLRDGAVAPPGGAEAGRERPSG